MVEVKFLAKGNKAVATKIDVRKLDKHQITKDLFMRDEYFRMIPDALLVRNIRKGYAKEYSNGKVVKVDTSKVVKLTVIGVPTYEIDRLNAEVANGALTSEEATSIFQGHDLEVQVVWSSDDGVCHTLLSQYSDTFKAVLEDHADDRILRGGKIGVRPKWVFNRSGEGGTFSGLELAYEEPLKVKVENLA